MQPRVRKSDWNSPRGKVNTSQTAPMLIQNQKHFRSTRVSDLVLFVQMIPVKYPKSTHLKSKVLFLGMGAFQNTMGQGGTIYSLKNWYLKIGYSCAGSSWYVSAQSGNCQSPIAHFTTHTSIALQTIGKVILPGGTLGLAFRSLAPATRTVPESSS